jgi:hypothetical protein
MNTNLKTVLLFFAIAQSVSATTNNYPVAPSVGAGLVGIQVKVGDTSIKLPSPGDEFVEVGYDNCDFLSYLSVPAENRLVCAYVMTNDFSRFSKRDRKLLLTRYIMVQVSRQDENRDCSDACFNDMVSGAKKIFGGNSDTAISSYFKEEENEINRRLKSLNVDGSVTVGQPVKLGSFFSMKDAYAFGMIAPLSFANKTLKMGGCAILLHVKSRTLFIYVYSEYKGQQTVHFLGNLGEKWMKQIIAANAE